MVNRAKLFFLVPKFHYGRSKCATILIDMHCIRNRNSLNFLVWRFCGNAVSAEFRMNRQKLWGNCVSTKVPHQETRWNYDILRSTFHDFFVLESNEMTCQSMFTSVDFSSSLLYQTCTALSSFKSVLVVT